jgi:hypothetical protein
MGLLPKAGAAPNTGAPPKVGEAPNAGLLKAEDDGLPKPDCWMVLFPELNPPLGDPKLEKRIFLKNVLRILSIQRGRNLHSQ